VQHKTDKRDQTKVQPYEGIDAHFHVQAKVFYKTAELFVNKDRSNRIFGPEQIMERDFQAELTQLKREYLDAERIYTTEKACLLKTMTTMGTLFDRDPAFSEEWQAIKSSLEPEGELPIDDIEAATLILRRKIFTEETKLGPDPDGMGPIDEAQMRLVKACKIIKRIMVPLLDGFYPISGELKTRADAIDITCHAEMAEQDLEVPATEFLNYIRGLKDRVSQDIRYINNTFFTMLEQVKELEKTLSTELQGDKRLKAMDSFESKMNEEFSAIVDSFDVSTAVNEIKTAVTNKLKKIKGLIAKNRKEEIKRIQKTNENIEKLQSRIIATEKDAQKMSKKAAYFRKAASKDGMTGLFNRKSFDIRLSDALNHFNNGGEPFSIVLFDVDSFKWVNDTFGHVAGDKVLKQVARALTDSFRKDDFIARYGGDEFVAFVGGLDEDLIQERIFKFNEMFRKNRFFSSSMEKDFRITVSAGIASAMSGDNPEDLTHRADMAMYDTKKKKSEK
jgi:diguanylate cyclase (GGDEF)-like protein